LKKIFDAHVKASDTAVKLCYKMTLNKQASPVHLLMETNQTPMLKQYHAVKAQNPDCVLLFRLGDFYEMFYDDAKIVSRTLDLVLTGRGQGTSRVPMCGFPHHAAENYIGRLIKAGHKVAICEQLEDPALAKGIVKRDVTRIITSGTYLDENNDDQRYLLSLSPNGKNFGMAIIDPAEGIIKTNEFGKDSGRLAEIICKLPVQECLYPENSESAVKALFNVPLLRTKQVTFSRWPDWNFNTDTNRRSLCEHFGVHNLNGFGIDDKSAAVSSAGALLEYMKTMNRQPLRHIDKVVLYDEDEHVFISPAAHLGLEMDNVVRTLDHTVTAMGRRLFRYWMQHPLKNISGILQRQDAIKTLKESGQVRENLRAILNKIPDIEKNISRLSCGYRHPKDLLSIRNALALLPEIAAIISPLRSKNDLFQVEDIPELRELLEKAVDPDMAVGNPDGKVIRPGYNKEIDELRGIQENGRQWLLDFQGREIKRTGINTLKVGFNKIFGYYIEISKGQAKNAPADFARKQTLVNAERFITQELKEYEEKILTAQDKILKLENELIDGLQKSVLDNSRRLHAFCNSISVIDALISFAIKSAEKGYVCPVVDESKIIDIRDGRHPVVEKIIEDNFIPNDTLLDSDKDHLIILTGPNMAGKSTYIRQSAVLTIMAQAGSFIPAASARIGIVDKIFTRIGAHDDISKGQSTFMVEMNETADILNNLTERSLVVLDEIGRGTSTYDGLSLAWSVAEHLANTKARTLFATHFHELTALADDRSGVKNYNVAVKEWQDEIIFLHKILPGSSDDSYGIYVAKLAGIPKTVIERAKQILTQLELKTDLKETLTAQGFTTLDVGRGTKDEKKHKDKDQLNLFIHNADDKARRLREEIEKIDINSLTPLQALNFIQMLKNELTRET
jgi:DNA mismatch repair protein MutS